MKASRPLWLPLLRPVAVVLLGVLTAFSSRAAEDTDTRPLPPPRMKGGLPLLNALSLRQSKREFRAEIMTDQRLSDLLWAAFGINRPTNDHRTAPSAQNTQDVDLYVARANGVFVYEAKGHALRKVTDQDLRGLTTSQDSLKAAPVQLVFVSDFARMPKVAPELRELYAGVDTGAIVQNVYLFAASEAMACVVHELDRAPLAKALNLRPDQHIILAQAVGWPK